MTDTYLNTPHEMTEEEIREMLASLMATIQKLTIFLDAKEKELKYCLTCEDCGTELNIESEGKMVCPKCPAHRVIATWYESGQWDLIQELRKEIGI